MTEVITYRVRVIQKGKVVETEAFKETNDALKFAEKQIDRDRAVRIRRIVKERKRLHIIPASAWGRRDHAPYEFGPLPLSTVFFHTSVTKQLSPKSDSAAERAEMRNVDNIAFGRGFNGISYSFGIFPSGRVYEGRGWGVVEAATEGFNTTADSICFIGNTDAFAPTEAQIEAAIALIDHGQRNGKLINAINVRGHREVAAKACPGKFVTQSILDDIERRARKTA